MVPATSTTTTSSNFHEFGADDGPSRGSAGALKRWIGRINVVVATRLAARESLLNAVEQQQCGSWGFCNANTIYLARGNVAFREALGRITLFNDGIGMDLASRLLYGEPFPENLNGTDLVPAVLAGLPSTTPVFLLGGKPGIAELAAEALERKHPNIMVVGVHHGFFTEQENPAIVSKIIGSGARLVLVGMGQPSQELWTARHQAHVLAPLLCVGAFLDFAAGRVPRAPGVVRRLRCEWLFRLAIEPRRLAKRYLVGGPAFLASIARDRWVS